MTRVLRILLMGLLILTVPVQGLAAASMAACSHGAADAQPVVAAHHHDPDTGIATHDDHHAEPSAETALLELGHGSCSSCASCSVGAALPFASVPFKPLPASQFFPVLPGSTIASFLTDGPERPPRNSLA